jgi:hypothetical protein
MGQILVVDAGLFGIGKIIRIDPVTGTQTILTSGDLFVRPFDLAIDASGQILVADTEAFGGSGGVIKVDPGSGVQTPLSFGDNFQGPAGITLDSTGQIFVADVDAFDGSGGIIKVDPITGFQTVISSEGDFVGPIRLVVDVSGQIFVSDQSAFRTGTTVGAIFRVDPVTGAQTVIYDSSSGGLIQGPAGITIDSAGQLLIAFHGHPDFDVPDGVARIDLSTNVVTLVSSNDILVHPHGIALASVVPGTPFFLHGTGANNNPSTLFLNNTPPSGTTAKFKDSAGLNFSGGNPWTDIGTWLADPAISSGTLSNLGTLYVWLGIKNSDDQGTQFDLRADVLKNGAVIASGQTRCVTGITRNAAKAKLVGVSFGPFPPVTLDGTTDELSLRVLTRIGTNADDTKCQGPGGSHNNAVGLRLYFDAVTRASRFNVMF